MKVLFIQDNAINESLALTELSGLLKSKGHECELLLEREERNIIKKIEYYDPDLIIFPFGILGQEYALRLSKEIKDVLSVPIIFSGSHPTFYPEIIEYPYVDIVCRGEAEYSILELLKRLETNKSIRNIRGLWVKQKNRIYKNPLSQIIENLDELPMPDREIYYKYKFLRNMPMKRFSSGRGCPHNCSYCFNFSLRKDYSIKRYTRKKSIERTIEEIKLVKNRHPLKHIHFSDDLFTFDKKWVEMFCKEYKEEVDLPFTFNSTANLINNGIIESVYRADCTGIAIGIESGNEKLRRIILNKNVTNEQILDAGRKIKKAGMKLATFNMLASPGETIKDAFLTMKLNQQIHVDNPRVTFSYPIKNTPLYDYSIKNGYLNEQEFSEIEAHISSAPKPVYKSPYMKMFENLFYLFKSGCKHPSFTNTIKKLIKMPTSKIFHILSITNPLDEKRFFNIPLIEGISYYYHCGNPFLRTTNYSSII